MKLEESDPTYLPGLRIILRRIELLGLLGVVRYLSLCLAEFLCLMFSLASLLLGRHDDGTARKGRERDYGCRAGGRCQ